MKKVKVWDANTLKREHIKGRRKWLKDSSKGVEGLQFTHPFDWESLRRTMAGEYGYPGATYRHEI